MTTQDPSTIFSGYLYAEAPYSGTLHGATATWGTFNTLSDDPGQGTLVDTSAPALFDNVSTQLANANNTVAVFTLATITEVSGYVLFKTNTVAAPSGLPGFYADGNIFYDNGNANIAIGHTTSGFSVGMVIDGDGDNVADTFGGGNVACPTGQWVYAQWYTFGGVLWLRISTAGSQGTWTSTNFNGAGGTFGSSGTSFCGQPTGTSNDLVMANATAVGGNRYDGNILSVGAKGWVIANAADFDGIGTWLQARYPSINIGFSSTAGPTVGTPPVNTHSPADYDGTSEYSQGEALSKYFTSGAWSVGILAYLRAAATDPGSGIRNTAPCLLSDSGNAISIAYTASGITVEVRDGTHSPSTLTAACSLNAWHYIQAYWDGTNLGLRIDNGAWSTAAYFNPSALTGLLQIGCNTDQTKFQSMQVLEVHTANVALSTAEFESARLDLKNIYALTIGTSTSAYTVNISELVAGLSQAIARGFVGSRAMGESMTISQAIARAQVAARAVPETLPSPSDALARAWSAARAQPETLPSPSQAIARAFVGSRGISEVTSIVDALARNMVQSRSFAETMAIADALTRSFGSTRSLSGALTISDAVSRSYLGARPINETLSVPAMALTRVYNAPRAVVESAAGVADGLARLVAAARAANESTTIGDTVARGVVQFRSIGEPLASPSDAVSRSVGTSRGIAESSSIADGWSRSTILSRAIGDTISSPSQALALTKAFARAVGEALSALADTVSRVFSGARPWTETLSPPGDSVVANVVGNGTRSVSESLSGLGDSWARSTAQARATSATLTIGDSWARSLVVGRPIGEILPSPSMALVRVAALSRAEPESVSGISDSLARSIGDARFIGETLPAPTIGLTRAGTASRSIGETTSLAFSSSRVLDASRGVPESLPAPAIAIARSLAAARVGIVESTTVAFDSQRTAGFSRGQSFATSIGDTIARSYGTEIDTTFTLRAPTDFVTALLFVNAFHPAHLLTHVVPFTLFVGAVRPHTRFRRALEPLTLFSTTVEPEDPSMGLKVNQVAIIKTELLVRDRDTDPTTIQLEVKRPDATRFTLIFGEDDELTQQTDENSVLIAGRYQAAVKCTMPGRWLFKWTSTGTAEGADEDFFEVDESNF